LRLRRAALPLPLPLPTPLGGAASSEASVGVSPMNGTTGRLWGEAGSAAAADAVGTGLLTSSTPPPLTPPLAPGTPVLAPDRPPLSLPADAAGFASASATSPSSPSAVIQPDLATGPGEDAGSSCCCGGASWPLRPSRSGTDVS
jgi:hypothetical protein